MDGDGVSKLVADQYVYVAWRDKKGNKAGQNARVVDFPKGGGKVRVKFTGVKKLYTANNADIGPPAPVTMQEFEAELKSFERKLKTGLSEMESEIETELWNMCGQKGKSVDDVAETKNDGRQLYTMPVEDGPDGPVINRPPQKFGQRLEWEDTENKWLDLWRAEGVTYEEIAVRLRRTPKSVGNKIEKSNALIFEDESPNVNLSALEEGILARLRAGPTWDGSETELISAALKHTFQRTDLPILIACRIKLQCDGRGYDEILGLEKLSDGYIRNFLVEHPEYDAPCVNICASAYSNSDISSLDHSCSEGLAGFDRSFSPLRRASDGGNFTTREVRDDLGGGVAAIFQCNNPWLKNRIELTMQLVLLPGASLVKCVKWKADHPVTLTTVNRKVSTDRGTNVPDGRVHSVFIGYTTKVARPGDSLCKVDEPGMFRSAGRKAHIVPPSPEAMEACVKHIPRH